MAQFNETYVAVTSLAQRYDVKELLALDDKYQEFKKELLTYNRLSSIDGQLIWDCYEEAIKKNEDVNQEGLNGDNKQMLIALQFKASKVTNSASNPTLSGDANAIERRFKDMLNLISSLEERVRTLESRLE
jgi:hypothetical protein